VSFDGLEIEARAAARRRVEEIKAFYVHLFVFVLVIALLIAVNVLFSDVWWVQWVVLGWGTGVAAHAFAVFGLASWEDRKIEEITQRLRTGAAATDAVRRQPDTVRERSADEHSERHN
jgi:hypothetical protein